MDHTAWEAASPVLFNTWKHHAGALRRRIAGAARAGPGELAALPERLLVIGTDLMDLYIGPRPPAAIGQEIIGILKDADCIAADAFAEWVEANGGYRVVELADATRWVLRRGEEGGRYVHLHPARGSPQTRRVRANVLRTAVMVLAASAALGGDPFDVAFVNDARRRFLGLPPIGRLAEAGGLPAVLELLRADQGRRTS